MSQPDETETFSQKFDFHFQAAGKKLMPRAISVPRARINNNESQAEIATAPFKAGQRK
jgi:hypothetical protein